MGYMNEYLLKNILSLKDNTNYAYLFVNTSPELIYQISDYTNKLPNNNLITLSISTSELNLPSISLFNGIDDKDKLIIFKKILYQNLITGLLLIQIYNKYPDLKIPRYNIDDIKEGIKESFKANYKDINPNNLLSIYLLEYVANILKYNNIFMAINVFISDDNNLLLQRSLNELLNSRHSYQTRFFTPNNELITYYDNNGTMQEETHDYHYRNLKGINFSKQK